MKERVQAEELVSTAWLQDNLNNLSIRIVEVGDSTSPRAYFKGHVPGAVHWPWQESLWHDTAREFVSPKAFSELMEQSGIGPDTTVVFYSNSAQYAHYAFWVCAMRGHSKAKILHGSRTLWVRERRLLVRDLPHIKPASYPVRSTDESSRLGREGVLAGLDNPDRVLLDLRSPEEYAGQRVSPKEWEVDHGAQRKGRIPGARHLFYRELLNQDDLFKPVDRLRESFAARQATPDKEIVFYCRLSHRASLGWFVARYLLGYGRTKVYDGSWTEWGSIVGYPVDK